MTTEKYSPNSSQQPLAFTQVVNNISIDNIVIACMYVMYMGKTIWQSLVVLYVDILLAIAPSDPLSDSQKRHYEQRS